MTSITGQQSEFQSLRDSNPKCNWMAQSIISSDRAYQKARSDMAGYYLERAFGSLELFENHVFEEQMIEGVMRLLA